jgi:protein involved in polysaccharide export with SLBB domain
MNRCQNQSSGGKLADAKGSVLRHWPVRILHLTAAVMAVVLCGCSILNAADATVTNRDKDGFIVNVAAATAAANAAPGNQAVTLPAKAVTTPGSTNAANMLDDKYRLTIGDQLSFQIIEDEDDPVRLVVTDSGDLQVPYIGRYPAVGKTCKELALALKLELEKEYYKQATVIVAVDLKPGSRGKIYLVGAIRAPGPQDISSDEVLTVSKAILRAGGFTDYADEKNVKVTRSAGTGPGGDKTFIVNVSQIFENGKTGNDMTLQPGDLVFIPERMVRF